MGEFHDRLIERTRALGAERVHIEHGGGRGSARRFRRHPHLTGEINGKPFKFPIKLRPRDASRHYRHAYLRQLEAYLREVGGLPPKRPDNPAIVTTAIKPKAARRRWRPTRPTTLRPSPAVDLTPTRLDRHPWAALQKLMAPKLSAAESAAAFVVKKETTMTKTNIDANGPYLVVAQTGEPISETDEYMEIPTIVMAVRATEQEAERERDRRNALNDGCSYFVMTADEYDQAA